MLLVHDTRPPFLDGRVIFTKQAEAIMPLRDPTSDLAVIAKTGSKLVKEIRDKKNEGKSRQRFWEVAGSKMGKITGWAPPLSIRHACPIIKASERQATSCLSTLNLNNSFVCILAMPCLLRWSRQPLEPCGYKAMLGMDSSLFQMAQATCKPHYGLLVIALMCETNLRDVCSNTMLLRSRS